MSNRLTNILIPVISVLLGIIVGTIIMLVSGYDPIAGYAALWNGIFGEIYYVGETIRQVTPYILAGLAVAFAFRTGLFNIGVEGQLIVGWLAAVWVGVAFDDLPKLIHLPLAIIAAALAGALWGFIPGLLKAKFRVHEVIVTIMMNYIALHVTNAIIRDVITDRKDRTEMIADTASLKSPFFESLTDYSRLHWGIFIALACVFIMWFLLEPACFTICRYEREWEHHPFHGHLGSFCRPCRSDGRSWDIRLCFNQGRIYRGRMRWYRGSPSWW